MEAETKPDENQEWPAWLPWLAGVGVLIILAVWYFAPFWEARSKVRYLMIDPESAEFREMHRGQNGAICGEVNSKNRLGAYTGFVAFYVVDGVAHVQPPDATELSIELQRSACR